MAGSIEPLRTFTGGRPSRIGLREYGVLVVWYEGDTAKRAFNEWYTHPELGRVKLYDLLKHLESGHGEEFSR